LKAENNKKLKEKKNWILLLLKKLAKILFNRIFYVAVAMLVQLGWIFLMVLRLAAFSRYVDIVIKLVGVVLVLWILNKEINPSYKLAWTMLILILPILGVVLYFVFGRSRIATIMQQHFEQRIEENICGTGRRQGRSWKSWIRQQRSSPDIFRMFPDFRFMRILPRNISR
jgi:cardiolipin synthase